MNRIKEIKHSDGESRFYPQIVVFGFWVDDVDDDGATISFNNIKDCKEWLKPSPPPKIIIHEN